MYNHTGGGRLWGGGMGESVMLLKEFLGSFVLKS